MTCFLLRCLPMILSEIKRCFSKMMEDQFAALKRIFPCSFELDLLFSCKFLRSHHISTCYSIRHFSWNLCVQANCFDIFLPDDFLLLELFEDTIIESIILFFSILLVAFFWIHLPKISACKILNQLWSIWPICVPINVAFNANTKLFLLYLFAVKIRFVISLLFNTVWF